MRLQKFGARVVVHAPAKLNLFFEVLGKRKDGYHEIETLVAPIALYDTLSFDGEASEELHLTCEPVPALGDRTRLGWAISRWARKTSWCVPWNCSVAARASGEVRACGW